MDSNFDDIIAAIVQCLSYNVPFVAYQLPDSDIICFFSNPSGGECTGGRTFSIGTWTRKNVMIYEELDAAATLKSIPSRSIFPEPAIYPCLCSTDKSDYIRQVETVVDILRQRGGKTVLSRVKCGKLSDSSNPAPKYWASVIQSYFGMNAGTFRYCYYTHATGAWLGASPEILLTADLQTGRYCTMSLAGTRAIGDVTERSESWDDKNMYEHTLVTDFLIESLKSIGLTPECGALTTRDLPALQHLCNYITGELGTVTPMQIISRINPTPALAGYPVDVALGEIALFERHPRQCYGGYVMLEDDNRLAAYVNLRCVHFCGRDFCLYGGGGLTSQSDPDMEWSETEVKMSVLERIISKVSDSCDWAESGQCS